MVHVCMIRSVCGSCVHDKEGVWFMCILRSVCGSCVHDKECVWFMCA